jgi:hypothetical protein
MTNEELSRCALGVVIGGLAAIAITKTGLTPQSATLRWIAYCVVSGVIINSQTGMKRQQLILAGFLSSLGLVGAILWIILLGSGAIPALSGIPLDLGKRAGFAASLLGGLLAISTLGVAICALARPAIFEVLQKLSNVDTDKAKKVESFLKISVSIAGTVALFLL